MTTENQTKEQETKVQLDEIHQLVCFKLADEEYAVNIINVQEVIRVVRITRIPQMPDFSLGVINVRGSIIPVFDLRKRFELAECELNNASKIMITGINGNKVSFIVDAILDNIKIHSKNIGSAPTVKMKIDKECIKGIGEIKGRLIMILDLEKVYELINSDILQAAGCDDNDQEI